MIGYVDLQGTEPRRRELGYVIGDSTRWRQGFGTQAARAGLTHAFAQAGLTSIWAEALTTNTASVRILQTLGMTEIAPGPDTSHRRFEIHRSARNSLP
ncbi:GNAT family N-acetyltransferase [Paractinoplanes deccanensis]|uniref:GNAT family N-acetyltransferase n=1 Tax=Paractinoplanes deccanensis TaxID=113561 RepID=UPI0027DEA908|nr:GNAT family N-acetyltransferase [Actinoplanes deccanensis]